MTKLRKIPAHVLMAHTVLDAVGTVPALGWWAVHNVIMKMGCVSVSLATLDQNVNRVCNATKIYSACSLS